MEVSTDWVEHDLTFMFSGQSDVTLRCLFYIWLFWYFWKQKMNILYINTTLFNQNQDSGNIVHLHKAIITEGETL